jgi:hypothetical protein
MAQVLVYFLMHFLPLEELDGGWRLWLLVGWGSRAVG